VLAVRERRRVYEREEAAIDADAETSAPST
jgi:hypothetical protein